PTRGGSGFGCMRQAGMVERTYGSEAHSESVRWWRVHINWPDAHRCESIVCICAIVPWSRSESQPANAYGSRRMPQMTEAQILAELRARGVTNISKVNLKQNRRTIFSIGGRGSLELNLHAGFATATPEILDAIAAL